MAGRARARGAVHRFRIRLRRRGGSLHRLDLRTARHPSESAQHLVARALAFALEARPDLELRFRPGGVSAGDEPALEARAPGGSCILAVEVGIPDARRLARALRRAAEVAVYCHRDPRPLDRALRRLGPTSGRLRVRVLPRELVERLAAALGPDNDWAIDLEGDTLAVVAEGGPAPGRAPRWAGRIGRLEV